MKHRNRGIDVFRIIAASMVVAIHTFPFQSIAPRLDELITLTIFRVAVPFFLMTTGYFVMGKQSLDPSYTNIERTKKYVGKIGLIYLGAIVLYLPLSFINGTLSLKTNLFTFSKLLLFDGTFYHLWYFPGLMMGVGLTALLIKVLKFNKTFALSICLYLIGLGGDSWYGIVGSIPLFDKFYGFLFIWMEYTRSGLFLVPIFLCLGILIYRQQEFFQHLKHVKLLLVLFLVGMLGESTILHQLTKVRHDSMYLFLPLCMLYLYVVLLKWQPKIEIKNAANLSLLVYILHPILIVVVHFLSNHLLFLKNSVLNYILVLAGSLVAAQILVYLMDRVRARKKPTPTPRAAREISRQALGHNLAEIRKILPKQTKIMGVVKANAYGCDMVNIAKELERNGVHFLCVATIDEAIVLRKAAVQADILLLGYTDPARIKEIKKYNLIQSIVSEEHGRKLNLKRIPIRCHLQVDTGMHRLGLAPEAKNIQSFYRLNYLQIEGIYSHLGSSDSLEEEAVLRTKKQLELFTKVLNDLKEAGISYGYTHIQSSYGLLNYPEYHFDFVRAGIILYGFLSDGSSPTKISLDLRPVVQIKAALVLKRSVSAGEYIGYGLETQLEKNAIIGVVSIGYADGIPRALSNQGFMLEFKGQQLRQLGNICMDMLLVDLTEIEAIAVNDEVTVLPDIEKTAVEQKTITNEILSRLGTRLSSEING